METADLTKLVAEIRARLQESGAAGFATMPIKVTRDSPTAVLFPNTGLDADAIKQILNQLVAGVQDAFTTTTTTTTTPTTTITTVAATTAAPTLQDKAMAGAGETTRSVPDEQFGPGSQTNVTEVRKFCLPGQRLVQRKCVQIEGVCGEGTQFDDGTMTCVPVGGLKFHLASGEELNTTGIIGQVCQGKADPTTLCGEYNVWEYTLGEDKNRWNVNGTCELDDTYVKHVPFGLAPPPMWSFYGLIASAAIIMCIFCASVCVSDTTALLCSAALFACANPNTAHNHFNTPHTPDLWTGHSVHANTSNTLVLWTGHSVRAMQYVPRKHRSAIIFSCPPCRCAAPYVVCLSYTIMQPSCVGRGWGLLGKIASFFATPQVPVLVPAICNDPSMARQWRGVMHGTHIKI